MMMQFWSLEPLSLFRPCVDSGMEAPFLPVEPLEALQQGKVADVPWLIGVTSGEGVFRLAEILSTRSAEARAGLKKNFDEIMPVVLGLNVSFPSYQVKPAWMQIELLYYGNREADPFMDDGRTLSNLYADRLFLHGWRKAIIYHHRFARADNIYAYVFNYSGSRTFQSYYAHGESNKGRAEWLSQLGACHGDDLLHLFEMPRLFPAATAGDREATRAMVSLWTKFAKDGYPVANRESPSEESGCRRADGPEAQWPAASESSPWFAELRGGSGGGGGRLHACPRLALGAADRRLALWDALPMAENLDLSLARDMLHAPTTHHTFYDDFEEGDESLAVPRGATTPRSLLRPLLWGFHLLAVSYISL